MVAYELLFRSSLENVFGKNDPNRASLQMMDTTLLGFGLDSLLGDKSGFFNTSREVLVRQQWAVLPPARTVIEVLETVEPDAEVEAACRAARQAGYRVALDDFVFRPEYESLLPFADYIKIDFIVTKGREREEVVRRLAGRGTCMLAEKVETYEEFNIGLAAGYELFQGFFFCRPEMVTGKDVSAAKTNLVRLIQEINRPEIDFDRLEALIKQDVALSVRLLRYLRSAGFGWRHEVTTIGQALRVLGERDARKWASLVALTMIGEDKPPELITTSLVRAQFCEELGADGALPDTKADLFLTGLLSTLEALLDRPLAQTLEQMAISDSIHHALLGGDNTLGDTLALAVAYDRADWDRVGTLAKRIDYRERGVPEAYRRAVEWVTKIRGT